MISLQLTDIKNFMNQLLRGEIFDHFLMPEAVISQDITFTIDGHLKKDYFFREELEEQNLTVGDILPYSYMRPALYQLIRGKKTPVYFKFVLMLSPINLEKTLSLSESGLTPLDVGGMFLNITYQNGSLAATTGISYKTFTTEKTLNHEWDKMVKKFLSKHSIAWEEA